MESVAQAENPLLEVHDLSTHFFTRAGRVQAVDGVSIRVMPGETLGMVGESGSGKTITCLSILKLLPRGARIVSGRILFDGEDLAPKADAEMEAIRGKHIGLIMQNSMTALDPVFTDWPPGCGAPGGAPAACLERGAAASNRAPQDGTHRRRGVAPQAVPT
jgi:ABC-type oligopeptide transport system ATPase subunit